MDLGALVPAFRRGGRRRRGRDRRRLGSCLAGADDVGQREPGIRRREHRAHVLQIGQQRVALALQGGDVLFGRVSHRGRLRVGLGADPASLVACRGDDGRGLFLSLVQCGRRRLLRVERELLGPLRRLRQAPFCGLGPALGVGDHGLRALAGLCVDGAALVGAALAQIRDLAVHRGAQGGDDLVGLAAKPCGVAGRLRANLGHLFFCGGAHFGQLRVDVGPLGLDVVVDLRAHGRDLVRRRCADPIRLPLGRGDEFFCGAVRVDRQSVRLLT